MHQDQLPSEEPAPRERCPLRRYLRDLRDRNGIMNKNINFRKEKKREKKIPPNLTSDLRIKS
jgi:hypothetical protein